MLYGGTDGAGWEARGTAPPRRPHKYSIPHHSLCCADLRRCNPRGLIKSKVMGAVAGFDMQKVRTRVSEWRSPLKSKVMRYMMDEYIKMIIQGIIQGLTEFLPVSSSGHLSVAQHFMNVEDAGMLTSVVLHLGTLVAVFAAFWGRIWGMVKEFFLSIADIFRGRFRWKGMNDNRRMMCAVIIATLLLVPFALVKDFFTNPASDSDIIFEGCAFIFTSIVLMLSDSCVKGMKTGKDIRVRDALTVGMFQVFALFPGVSRSGSTVSAGLFCGLARDTAVAFSFILGIPAILGSAVLEAKDLIGTDVQMNVPVLAVGAVTAAVVGFACIKLVQVIIKHDKFKIFGIYTLLLGLACIGTGIYETVTGTRLTIM